MSRQAPSTLVLVPSRPEWSGWQKQFGLIKTQTPALFESGLRSGFSLLQIGVGPSTSAKTLARNLEKLQPKQILMFGTCGGLQPQLVPGDLIIPSTVATQSKRIELQNHANEKLRQAAQKTQLNFNTGALWQSDDIVGTADEKKALYHTSQVHAVDMESFAIAQICQEQKIPLGIARFVFDTVDENFPWSTNTLTDDGELMIGAVLKNLWQNPKLIKNLPSFARRQKLIAQKMAGLLTMYLDC